MFLISILLQVTIGAKLVEYKFYKNYGQIFYDFSGNSRHGVNGIGTNVDSDDVICTDRGALFTATSDKVIVPPNNVDSRSFELPSTSSIVFWRKWIPESSKINFSIFYRKFDQFYIHLQRTSKPDTLSFTFETTCHAGNYNSIQDLITCKE